MVSTVMDRWSSFFENIPLALLGVVALKLESVLDFEGYATKFVWAMVPSQQIDFKSYKKFPGCLN